jgi:acetylornithine deacetylase/succinyl-diaminopimelate desuccinylase-like protein
LKIIKRIVQRAIEIQQIPAPTFSERQRAEYIHTAFLQEGLAEVEIDSMGNVYACLPGRSSSSSLVLSAHTDTVFPVETDLTVTQDQTQVFGPGIGDNSVGVAGLFGLIWELRHRGIELPGDLWLVANIAEEGLGDLVGMKQVVDRFGDAPIGYVVLEGLAFGRLYHRGLGVRRYHISVETAGGHSWVDYGSPSAIHELTSIITEILSLRLPLRKRTSVNVGKISGGVSINSIAPKAQLELDLRSEDHRALSSLSGKVEELVRFAERPGVHFEIKVIGDRPFGEIPSEHPLVQLGVKSLAEQDVAADLLIGSTDANVPLSRGIPAICIGLANGGGAHTVGEFLDTELLPKGMAQLVAVVVGAFDLDY